MKRQKKAYLSASIGNILEFYDFALFGFYAPIFSKLYFPMDQSLNSLLLSFTVFAVGFLCRPLGAIIFGYIGDRFARKTALSFSLFGIGLATCAMGMLPTYKTWGIFSPLCLSLLRIIQGISMGGEYSNSLIYVTEYLKKYQAKLPAFTTGMVSSMGVLGWFLASLFCIVFRDESLSLFSWRIPFLFGSLVAAWGCFIRKGTQDAFEEPSTKHYTIMTNLSNVFLYKQASIKVFSIGALMGILFYGQFIFNNSFLPKVSSFSGPQVSKMISIGIFSYMFALPIVGFLSDRFGYKKSMFLSALLSGIFGPLIFQLQFSGSTAFIIAAQITSAFLLAMLMAPGAYVMSLSFPQHIRCTGVSLCYNLGATLFGGITPSIYLLLYKFSGSVHGMTAFFSVVALSTAFVFFKIREAHQKRTSENFEELFFRKLAKEPEKFPLTILFSKRVCLFPLSHNAKKRPLMHQITALAHSYLSK